MPLRRLRERRDLPAQGQLPPGHGFQVLIEAPETEDAASATMLLGEEAVPLNPAALQPRPFRPRGGMDAPDREGIRGWVFDIPGEEPLVRIDGGEPIPVPLTLPRPDLPFDDGSDTLLLGFHLSVEALRRIRPDAVLTDGKPHEVVLVASGVELAQGTLVLVPPAAPGPAPGAVPGQTPRPKGARIHGHVEIFARRGRFVFVVGWFRAPEDRLAAETPCLILRWGEEQLEMPLRRLRNRRDLPAQGDLPAGRGFQFLLKAPETGDAATAALRLGEDLSPLNPPALQPTPFTPRGTMDVGDREGVRGWVLDEAGAPLFLVLDDCEPIPVPLTVQRPDLPFDNGTDSFLFGFHLPIEALTDSLRDSDPGALLFDGKPRDLVLLSSGVVIVRRTLAFRRDIIGKLERTDNEEAKGWVAERGRPQDMQAVDLLLDGTRWATVTADIDRPDLTRAGVVHRGGGFRIALPHLHPGEGGPLGIAAMPRLAVQPLAGEVVKEAVPAWRKGRGDLAFRLPEEGGPRVVVVVPIYNAAAELDRCIASLVRHTTAPARLILVDDASPQPEMAEVLRRWADTPGIEIHRNPGNLGFTRTANRGMALAGRDDVVLLNSDTAVGPGWLDGLRAAAYSGPRTGTATAISNNSGAFSVPELGIDNPMPPWFGVDEMARLVRGAALSLYPTVPTGHGFCLYIRRDCLDEVGVLDEAAFPRGYGEENDLCMRAGRAGWENVLDDRTFVWHQRSASFGAEKQGLSAAGSQVVDERYPDYRTLIGLFERDPAILAVRWRVRRAEARARAVGAVPRPRVLFVISTESGGTPQTNRDLMDALSDRYEPWVLRCDSRALTLSRHIPAELRAEGGPVAEPVEEHRLERRIAPATHGSAEYDRIAADLILRHGFELVHVRHIAWHGTGLTRVCRRLGVPVVFSFHDFYTACPVTKLLDAEGRFCGGPCTEGEADCTAELWPAEAVPPLRHRFVHRWQEMMAEALRACDAFVTTSPSAQRVMTDNFPFLAERDFRVIPHGRSFARMEGLGAEPSLDEKLRVLVPGNVSGAKGGGLVAAMAAIDRGRQVEFHVLGGVDSTLANAPGIVLHGRYDRADFAAHVARIRPHLGAVLSLWPETYCHTLTECWAAGLPVMATALGALAERIGESGGGWLVDRWMEPEAMLAELLRLRRDPAEVRARRDEVLDWQARTGRHRTTTAMAAEYDRLYREVLDRRRAFRAEPERPRVVLTLDAPRGALPSPLAAATRNAVSRPFIFRPILPSFSFGDPSAGTADAVLVATDALPAEDLAALRQRCAAIGLPVIAAPVGEPETGAPGEEIFLGEGLDLASWLSDGPPAVPGAASAAGPEAGVPCRVLFATTGDDAQLAALYPVFDDLTALGVATLGVLGALPAAWYQALGVAEMDGVAALRRTARDHDLGLAHAGPALLAMQAAGLPVLAIPPALAGEDPVAADLARDVLLRQVAELSVDTPRRAALGREGRRAARAAMLAHPAGTGIDLHLRSLLRDQQAPPSAEAGEEGPHGLLSEDPVA